MSKLDLRHNSIAKLFFSFAIPAMIGISVFSLYSLVDSVFVARQCGTDALSAVQLCAPILSLFSCLSLVVGIGGSTLCSIAQGKKENRMAQEIFSMCTISIFTISVLLSLLMILFHREIIDLLCSDVNNLENMRSYLIPSALFAPFYMLSSWLPLALEADGHPAIAMAGNMCMAIGNIILDYLMIYIFDFGVRGAALASGFSSMVAVVFYCMYLLGVSNTFLRIVSFHFDLNKMIRILYNGLSEGVTSIGTVVISYIYNLLIIKNGDTETHAVFSATMVVVNFIGAVLIGASQGIGPLISTNFGARDYGRVKEIVHKYILYEVSFSICVCTVSLLYYKNINQLFLLDNQILLREIALAYTPLLILTPCNAIIISYFTAIDDAKTSMQLSILRVFLIRLIVIFTFLLLFGLKGIWYSAAVSESLALILCIYTWERHKKCFYKQ